MIMRSCTALLLLQLLPLTSVVSASHHWGGNMNVAYKGRNPDGTFKVRKTYFYLQLQKAIMFLIYRFIVLSVVTQTK